MSIELLINALHIAFEEGEIAIHVKAVRENKTTVCSLTCLYFYIYSSSTTIELDLF